VARWANGCIALIDQTLLPDRYEVIRLTRVDEVWEAIHMLRVRGAPAIGIAAAYGLCLGLQEAAAGDGEEFFRRLRETKDYLASSRPTAVNLVWALDRVAGVAGANPSLPPKRLWRRLLREAKAIHAEEIECNEAIGRQGASLFNRSGMNILTHCNTGSLATGGIGTALGAILTAAARRNIHVWIDETRPLLQGARLNTWELQRYGVRATLICDNMAATLMAQGRVDAVILGADRIARNGDFANKIGTYSLAALCRFHKIPFYCAAPISTFDWATPNGAAIPIEERSGEEVRGFRDARWAPPTVPVYNPSFDVTPGRLITAFISENGIARPPFTKSLKAWRP
jgi:methylthioribose-1-phosphate isomerase